MAKEKLSCSVTYSRYVTGVKTVNSFPFLKYLNCLYLQAVSIHKKFVDRKDSKGVQFIQMMEQKKKTRKKKRASIKEKYLIK